MPFLVAAGNDPGKRAGEKGLILTDIKTILLPLALDSLAILRENVASPIGEGIDELPKEGVFVPFFVPASDDGPDQQSPGSRRGTSRRSVKFLIG